jgi:hypothetical protein
MIMVSRFLSVFSLFRKKLKDAYEITFLSCIRVCPSVCVSPSILEAYEIALLSV